jgi:hypothetical protein
VIASIIRALLAGLWKPLAAAFGGLALYLKGGAAAKAKNAAKADRATIETIKEVKDAQKFSHAGGGSWHGRLRETKPRD